MNKAFSRTRTRSAARWTVSRMRHGEDVPLPRARAPGAARGEAVVYDATPDGLRQGADYVQDLVEAAQKSKVSPRLPGEAAAAVRRRSRDLGQGFASEV